MEYSAKITFGKHKGTEYKQLPVGYLRWLADQNIQHGGYNWSELARKHIQQRGLNAYVSPDEIETSRREQEAIDASYAEADRKMDEVINRQTVRWTTKSGNRIRVVVWSADELEVSIDGRESVTYDGFSPVPASSATIAKANGIVALIGRVGVTAEQKAAIEAKIQK